jgi:hypothetical protein
MRRRCGAAQRFVRARLSGEPLLPVGLQPAISSRLVPRLRRPSSILGCWDGFCVAGVLAAYGVFSIGAIRMRSHKVGLQRSPVIQCTAMFTPLKHRL